MDPLCPGVKCGQVWGRAQLLGTVRTGDIRPVGPAPAHAGVVGAEVGWRVRSRSRYRLALPALMHTAPCLSRTGRQIIPGGIRSRLYP